MTASDPLAGVVVEHNRASGVLRLLQASTDDIVRRQLADEYLYCIRRADALVDEWLTLGAVYATEDSGPF